MIRIFGIINAFSGLLILLFTPIVSGYWANEYYTCAAQYTDRNIILERESNSNKVPCQILEIKDNGDVKSLWKASNDPNYCNVKINGYLDKLHSLGFECNVTPEADRYRYEEYRNIPTVDQKIELDHEKMRGNERFIGSVDTREYTICLENNNNLEHKTTTDDAGQIALFGTKLEVSHVGENNNLLHIYAEDNPNSNWKVRSASDASEFFWVPQCTSPKYYSELLEQAESANKRLNADNEHYLVPKNGGVSLQINTESESIINGGKYAYAYIIQVEHEREDRLQSGFIDSAPYNLGQIKIILSNWDRCSSAQFTVSANPDDSAEERAVFREKIKQNDNKLLNDFKIGWLDDPYDRDGRPLFTRFSCI